MRFVDLLRQNLTFVPYLSLRFASSYDASFVYRRSGAAALRKRRVARRRNKRSRRRYFNDNTE